jgi:Uma2 family endonuclease
MVRDLLRTVHGTEHDMGMPAVKRRWSRSEVLALIDDTPLHSPRYEVVDGELLVTPSPGGPHQIALLHLARALASYCEEAGIGETMVSPFDVEVEAGTLVQPDVFVVPPHEAARLRQQRTARTVILAVEILSVGTERTDRGRKRALYQRTVADYWIIDVDARQLERWTSASVVAEINRDRLEWVPEGVGVSFVLDLPEFFRRVWGEA